MKKTSRKQLRFMVFLLLMWSWHSSPVYGQQFEALTPTEILVNEIADGTASLSQYQDLAAFAEQQQLTEDITSLLAKPETENFFEKNFNPDGAYGERKNGLIVDDWDTLAKGMGTTGAVLAGAYAVWRSRRRDYLAQLRAGDEARIEELLDKSFGKLNGTTLETVVPKTGEQWEEWAIEKGIPGAGALVAGMYLVWKRRREGGVTAGLEIYDDSYTEPNMSWWNFYQNVYQKAYANVDRDIEEGLAAQGLGERPAPPQESRALRYYNERNLSYQTIGRILDSSQSHLARSGSRIVYDSPAQIMANIDGGLNKSLQVYIATYKQKEAGINPWYASDSVFYRRPLTNVRNYLHQAKAYLTPEQFTAYEAKINHLEVNHRQVYTDTKAEKAGYDAQYAQYQADLQVYNTASGAIRSQAWSKYNQIMNGLYTYYAQARQRFADKAIWKEKLAEWAQTVTASFQNHQANQRVVLRDTLDLISKHLSAEEIEQFAAGTLQVEVDPSLQMTVEEMAAKIELQKQGLRALGDQEYQRRYAQAMTLNQGAIHPTWPDKNKVRADYIAQNTKRLDQELLDYQKAKEVYDFRRLLGAGEIDLESDLQDLFPPVVTEDMSALEKEISDLEAQKQQELNKALNTFNNGFNAIRPRYVTFAHNYHNGNWNRYKHRQSSTTLRSVKALEDRWKAEKARIAQKYTMVDELKENLNVAKSVYLQALEQRDIRIKEYENFRKNAYQVNQSRQFVQRLEGVATKSQFFAGQKSDLAVLSDYDAQIAELRVQMEAGKSPFHSEKSQLQADMAVTNKYTPVEFLQKFQPETYKKYLRGEVSWTTIESIATDATNVGKGSPMAEESLGNYLRGITSNFGGHSEEKIRVLTGLVDKAFEYRLDSYSGWERYYREHPLVRETKDQIRLERLQVIAEAEAERTAYLEQQIAELEKNKQQTLDTLLSTQEYLVQTVEERAANDFTDTVVEYEVAAATQKIEVNGTSRLSALAAVQSQELEEKITTQLNTLGEGGAADTVTQSQAAQRYYDKYYGGTLKRTIDQMTWNSSETGKAWIDSFYDAQGTDKHNTPHYAGGSYAASQGRAPAKEFITIRDEGGNLVDIPVAPPAVAPNLPYIAAKYGTDSEEYAESVKQYNDFQLRSVAPAAADPASQFDYVPTNPGQVELVETYEEALTREAAERAQVLHEAELAAERGRIQAENARIAREQLLQVEQAEAPISEGLVTEVEEAAKKLIDLKTPTTATEVRIDPNYDGPIKLEGDTLIVSTNERSLIEALVQRNISALRVGAEGIVIGGLELTILAAEGVSKLIKLASPGDSSFGYAIANSFDQQADQVQKDIEWYTKNAVYSEHLTDLENQSIFLAGGLVSVGGVATKIASKADILLDTLQSFGDDLLRGGDEIIKAITQQPEYATAGNQLDNITAEPSGASWTEKVQNWFSDTWGDIKQQFSGNGGSGKVYDTSWMADSPNFKNGVYQIRGEVQREGVPINLAFQNGKFGTLIPGKSYLGSVPSTLNIDFVLLADGKTLRFGESHSFLSGENPVRYAGQIKLSEGKTGIAGWNNGSGHFEPSLEDPEGIDLARSAFKEQFGIDLPDIKHFNQEL